MKMFPSLLVATALLLSTAVRTYSLSLFSLDRGLASSMSWWMDIRGWNYSDVNGDKQVMENPCLGS